VTTCGRICSNRQKINLSQLFAGQKLGIKEVDDGIWLVSFMHYDLGYFDLEQNTLQPLDNPFGTRLSPISLGYISLRYILLPMSPGLDKCQYGGVRSPMRTGLEPELPDNWLFAGYFPQFGPVIENPTSNRCSTSMT